MSLQALPHEWMEILTAETFEQIATGDRKVKTKDCLPQGKYPVIDQGQSDISGYINDQSKVIEVTEPLTLFGDHTRAVKWISQDFVPGADGTKILSCFDFVDPRFFYYQIRSLELPDKGYARHFKFLNESPFRLPPLAEQKQIAAKLDELLAQVETLEARLDAIPAIIKKFRQSVLAAAVSGRLTSPNTKKMNEVGLGDDVVSVPNSWQLSSLDELIKSERSLCYGVVQPGEEVSEGIDLIRVCDIELGSIDWTSLRKISQEIDRQYQRSRIQLGDILITIVGSIGRTALVDRDHEANIARAVARISPNTKTAISGWIYLWLSSPTVQWWLVNSSKEVARKTLNLKELRETPVAVPSIEEQTQIVHRVEQLFAFADQIEQRVKDAQARVNHLTQSILAKAFRGELTVEWRAQNPDLISGENSAEALLARIRAARQAQPQKGRGKRQKAMQS